MQNNKVKRKSNILIGVMLFIIFFMVGSSILIKYTFYKIERKVEINELFKESNIVEDEKLGLEIKEVVSTIMVKVFFIYCVLIVIGFIVLFKWLNKQFVSKIKQLESELIENPNTEINDKEWFNNQDNIDEMINSIHQYKDRLNYYTKYDNLTGLINRGTLIKELDREIEIDKDKKLVLAYINLDGFSYFNNNYGYSKGDEILKKVAQELSSYVTTNNIVARIGGDEFAVLLKEDDAIEEVNSYIEGLLEKINSIKNTTKGGFVSASIGVCVKGKKEKSASVMINNAYLAMTRVRERQKNSYEIFVKSNKKDISIEMVEKALKRGEIHIHYQPKINLRTNTIDGVEALVRWFDNEHGYISPGSFIKIAEDTGYIITLGEWILNKAVREIKQLNDELGINLSVAVNVSPIQFLQKRFVQKIKSVLSENSMPARNLELELTEGIGLFNSKDVIQKFEDISNLGVSIAIDDFGTGYSSIKYLKEFKIDTIKIDRSFIVSGEKNKNLVRYIIDVSKTLDVTVVAEGVEDYKQARMLKELDCDYIQGYFFYKPMPLVRLRELLKRN